MLGKTEGRRRRGRQRTRWSDGVMDSMDNESEQSLGDSKEQDGRSMTDQLFGVCRDSDMVFENSSSELR